MLHFFLFPFIPPINTRYSNEAEHKRVCADRRPLAAASVPSVQRRFWAPTEFCAAFPELAWCYSFARKSPHFSQLAGTCVSFFFFLTNGCNHFVLFSSFRCLYNAYFEHRSVTSDLTRLQWLKLTFLCPTTMYSLLWEAAVWGLHTENVWQSEIHLKWPIERRVDKLHGRASTTLWHRATASELWLEHYTIASIDKARRPWAAWPALLAFRMQFYFSE